MKQNDNLVKLAKITNTAASFLIFLAGLMLIFLPAAIAGGACGYFYNEQAGFAAAVSVALMMLLLVRKSR